MKNKRVDLRNITTRDFMMTYIPPNKNPNIFIRVKTMNVDVCIYDKHHIY